MPLVVSHIMCRLMGGNIYNFGSITQIPSFADSEQVRSILNSLPISGSPIERTIEYVSSIEGSEYQLIQTITKYGSTNFNGLMVETRVVDVNGNLITGVDADAILAAHGQIISSTNSSGR